jgi:hypothetical protein
MYQLDPGIELRVIVRPVMTGPTQSSAVRNIIRAAV